MVEVVSVADELETEVSAVESISEVLEAAGGK